MHVFPSSHNMEVPKNTTLIYYLSKMFLQGFNSVHHLHLRE